MKKLKSNTEDKSLVLESGKTYKFAGYSWTACEVNNDRHVAVIQSWCMARICNVSIWKWQLLFQIH